MYNSFPYPYGFQPQRTEVVRVNGRGGAETYAIVTNLIDQYRWTNGEPPPAMQAVYDYLHKKHIDHAAKVKALQAMYKA